MIRAVKLTLAVCMCLSVFGLSSFAWSETTITINGSTTALPIMQSMVETYMQQNPEVTLTLSGGGSGNGIKALMDKVTDIAMSSREMKPTELDMAKDKGVEPKSLAIAIDAVVPIVHPSNPVNSLTRAQMSDIFSGKITNWQEVGGPDRKIVVVSRDSSSGTYEAWNELVMNKEKVAPAALLSASSGALLQTVSKNKNAIGYDSYGYLNDTVKALRVEDIEGTPTTVSNGSYPISRKLWLITAGEPTGEIAKFLAFVLSPEGQDIVRKNGAVPIK